MGFHRNFGVISDSPGNLKMANVIAFQDVPPSVLDVLRLFLVASSRGEQVSLVLESRKKTMTSKYRCFGSMTGSPVTANTAPTQKKRRSKLRQEKFFT